MKQKKHTVNERIHLLEKMCYRLNLEVEGATKAIIAIVKAIEMTKDKADESV